MQMWFHAEIVRSVSGRTEIMRLPAKIRNICSVTFSQDVEPRWGWRHVAADCEAVQQQSPGSRSAPRFRTQHTTPTPKGLNIPSRWPPLGFGGIVYTSGVHHATLDVVMRPFEGRILVKIWETSDGAIACADLRSSCVLDEKPYAVSQICRRPETPLRIPRRNP
jgi:hypothetical protein